jgi:hypothetical protein
MGSIPQAPTISRFFGPTITMYFDDHEPAGARRCDTERDRATAMIGLTPDIVDVSVPTHGVLRLTFSDGVRGEVGVLGRMRGPVFERARTPEGFAQVIVNRETGTVVLAGRRGPRPRHALYADPERPMAGAEQSRLDRS